MDAMIYSSSNTPLFQVSLSIPATESLTIEFQLQTDLFQIISSFTQDSQADELHYYLKFAHSRMGHKLKAITSFTIAANLMKQ
jgi:hypothetical protein